MPNVRRRKKPCHCKDHKGTLIHYKAFQRCAKRRELDAVNNAYNQPLISRQRPAIDPQSPVQMRVTPSDYYEFNDDMDTLLFQLYANHVHDRSSEESVTHNLITISNNMRSYLPPELHAKIPRTYKQFAAKFDPFLQRLIRLPMCPGDCQCLEGTDPSEHYFCWCNGKANVPWRKISRGRLMANREFVIISLADTVRTWWSNSKIAELLRYGFEYKEQDQQFDVQDGDLWKEFIARGVYVYELGMQYFNRYAYMGISILIL